MSHVIRTLALLVSAGLVAACGQKGPLFLPGNPSQIRTEVPATEGTAGEEDEREAEDDPDRDDEPPR